MKVKLIIFFSLLGLILGLRLLGVDQFLSFDSLKANHAQIQMYYENHKMLAVIIYFCVYVFVTTLSIPAATGLTLLGGAIFGLGLGLLIVSFASTIGATFSFLLARTLLKDLVQRKFSSHLVKINKGIKREGAFYLFSLRLMPVFPFFLINLGMGLTPIPLWKYFIVSQVAMLPATAVYINAGLQLSQIDSISGIMSAEVLSSLFLIGLFPLVTKKIMKSLRNKRANTSRSLE